MQEEIHQYFRNNTEYTIEILKRSWGNAVIVCKTFLTNELNSGGEIRMGTVLQE